MPLTTVWAAMEPGTSMIQDIRDAHIASTRFERFKRFPHRPYKADGTDRRKGEELNILSTKGKPKHKRMNPADNGASY